MEKLATPASRPGPGAIAGGSTQQASRLLAEGLQHHQAGQLDAAERHYLDALRLVPNQPDALHLLGVLALQRGQPTGAIAQIRRAIAEQPQNSAYHCNLGVALQTVGQLDNARASLERAVTLDPGSVDALFNLGVTLQGLGQLDAAVKRYIQTLTVQPGHPGALQNLSNTLVALAQCHQQAGRLDDAIVTYQQALKLQPAHPETWHNLGRALLVADRATEAVECQRRALAELDAIDATSPGPTDGRLRLGILRNLAAALYPAGQAGEAVHVLRAVVGLTPDNAANWRSLGMAEALIGAADEAVAAYTRSLALNPADPDTHSKLIFVQDLLPTTTLEEAYRQRRVWNDRFARPLAATIKPHRNTPDPERRLRIGYVSADFSRHSAATTFLTVLEAHDPASVEVTCYAANEWHDDYTDRFQALAARWRPIHTLSDDALAAQIRADEIDILVDLSSHSGGNRLLTFARKPAPIQATAWGYATGTGLDTIDVFFADPIAVPPEHRRWYAEEIVDLPNLIGFTAPPSPPPLAPLPALDRGYVTFGSYNRPIKITPDVLDAWARVLLAVPASRLVLKPGNQDSPVTRERLLGPLVQRGIDPARVDMLGHSQHAEHLASFGQLDIQLDPFPHTGGVTTLEGLLMGVPCVTLVGERVPARLSASFLASVDLNDLVATSTDQYVEIAAQLARDVDRLAHERATLRERLLASPVGDARQYARAVEDAYRALWRRWCRGEGTGNRGQVTGGAIRA
jgi:predicted O-linked N-acetylglucosamine transferase (SPINDLY family)